MAGVSPSLRRDEIIELKGNSKDPSDNDHGSPIFDDYDVADSPWGNTNADEQDMQRLGKKQEFKRNFSFLSALGFVSVYMASWEFVLVSLSVGFSAGGFGGLFWCYLTTVSCYATIVASLAEMESMCDSSDDHSYLC